MRDDYRAWLEAEGYGANTIATQMSHVRKVERAYGKTLDQIAEAGGLAGLVSELTYSTGDERRGRANPSRLDIGGSLFKGLMSAKSAVALYARFLGADLSEPASTGTSSPSRPDEGGGPGLAPGDDRQRFALERDMQAALRRNIAQLDPGLTILDEGAERFVASGFIDILARDGAGALVVIELKAGKADARVIGQILGYMGDLASEEEAPIRGLIVAHDFDTRCRSAARAVPNLTLMRYEVAFTFHAEVTP